MRENEVGIYDSVPITWFNGIPSILPEGMDENSYKYEIKERWGLTPEKVHEELELACKTQSYSNKSIVDLISWIAVETHEQRLKFQEKLNEKEFLKPEINNETN